MDFSGGGGARRGGEKKNAAATCTRANRTPGGGGGRGRGQEEDGRRDTAKPMFPMKGNMKYESADGARQPGMRKDQFLVDFARRGVRGGGANTLIEFMILRPASDPDSISLFLSLSLSLSLSLESRRFIQMAFNGALPDSFVSSLQVILFPANDPVKYAGEMRGKQSSQV